jgi:diguanylate cyclase (GGDEF)-like protein
MPSSNDQYVSGAEFGPAPVSPPVESIERVLLKHVFENVREAMLFIGKSQKILAWNRAAESLIGINSGAYGDLDWLLSRIQFEPRQGTRFGGTELSLRDAIVGQVETMLYTSMTITGRAAVPVDVNVVPLVSASNQCLGSLVLLHDASYKVNLQQQVMELRAKTISDPLTGLANRAEFERVMEICCQHYRTANNDLSLIICDIDFFKSVNDLHGHSVGDQALVAFASLLQRSTRDADLVARYGGEEFVIVCNDCCGSAAVECAEKIRTRLEKTPLAFLGQKCLSASFGVAHFRREDTPATLFVRADQALLRAKETGRNRVVFGEYRSAGRTDFVQTDMPTAELIPTGNTILRQIFSSSSPPEVIAAKVQGFAHEQQAVIKSAELDRIVVHTSDEAVGLFRRTNDRRVGFKIEMQFRNAAATSPVSGRFTPQILVDVAVSVLRARDRRLTDVKQQAEHALRTLCGYLMIQPLGGESTR